MCSACGRHSRLYLLLTFRERSPPFISERILRSSWASITHSVIKQSDNVHRSASISGREISTIR